MKDKKFLDAMISLDADCGINVQIMIEEDVFTNPEQFNCVIVPITEKITNKYYPTWDEYPSDVWKVGNIVSIQVDTRIYQLNGEKIFRTEIGKILGMSIKINDNKEIENVYIKTLCENDQIKFFMLEDEDYLKPEEVGCYLISDNVPVKKKYKKINK